jgi:hypothetical protein
LSFERKEVPVPVLEIGLWFQGTSWFQTFSPEKNQKQNSSSSSPNQIQLKT